MYVFLLFVTDLFKNSILNDVGQINKHVAVKTSKHSASLKRF